MASAPPPYRPVLVQLAVLGLIGLIGHDDRGLSSMLTFGWVAVVPLAYAMARLPRVESRRFIHMAILGLYGLSYVSGVSFVDDRLDALLRIMAWLLTVEVLWWVVRAEFEPRALRVVRGIARYFVLPCVAFVCTCMPLGALAGPIDTWRESVVAQHHGPEHHEYVKVYDPSGAIMHFKVFQLYRIVPGLPWLERTLGVYGTGEWGYDHEHEFEWRESDDGHRSLVITASFCLPGPGEPSTCEGLPAEALCREVFELQDIGTWPAVRPTLLESDLDSCRSSSEVPSPQTPPPDIE